MFILCVLYHVYIYKDECISLLQLSDMRELPRTAPPPKAQGVLERDFQLYELYLLSEVWPFSHFHSRNLLALGFLADLK